MVELDIWVDLIMRWMSDVRAQTRLRALPDENKQGYGMRHFYAVQRMRYYYVYNVHRYQLAIQNEWAPRASKSRWLR